ncbi:hypothetical protein KP509_03G055200 [Ceratopteris richardii]|uniref:Reticulon-like protein n=1 Tax=Ceratopteris richardii TaxID=49495 RepID=A0A8T2V7D7_CERRI|nr:hypothetical protein KP509_03G055200 [Ceratopteris richardii]
MAAAAAAAAAAVLQGSGASSSYGEELRREELMESEAGTAEVVNFNRKPQSRSYRKKRTPLHSSRSISLLSDLSSAEKEPSRIKQKSICASQHNKFQAEEQEVNNIHMEVAAAAEATLQELISTSTHSHKLQGEEPMEREGETAALAKLGCGSQSRGLPNNYTPLVFPRSISPPLVLSSLEITTTRNEQKSTYENQQNTFQEAKDFQADNMMMRCEEDFPTAAFAKASTCYQSEAIHVRREKMMRSKSPYHARRTQSSMDDMDQVASKPLGSLRREGAEDSESVHLKKCKSPRIRKMASSLTVFEPLEASMKQKTRSSSMKFKMGSLNDLKDADGGMGDDKRSSHCNHFPPNTRQCKCRATEPLAVLASGTSPPSEQTIVHQSPTFNYHEQHLLGYPAAPYSAGHYSTVVPSSMQYSRRAIREARVVGSSDWLQFLGDIILWNHIPRSALLFGAGSFCIISASLIQDMQYSSFSVLAYMAFCFLALRFIKCNFGKGPVSRLCLGQLREADAICLVRIVLPPVNLILQKLGNLFSGEPVNTLKAEYSPLSLSLSLFFRFVCMCVCVTARTRVCVCVCVCVLGGRLL